MLSTLLMHEKELLIKRKVSRLKFTNQLLDSNYLLKSDLQKFSE